MVMEGIQVLPCLASATLFHIGGRLRIMERPAMFGSVFRIGDAQVIQ
jgi:hypothetical protein